MDRTQSLPYVKAMKQNFTPDVSRKIAKDAEKSVFYYPGGKKRISPLALKTKTFTIKVNDADDLLVRYRLEKGKTSDPNRAWRSRVELVNPLPKELFGEEGVGTGGNVGLGAGTSPEKVINDGLDDFRDSFLI